MSYENGLKYQGTFEKGNKHGQGVLSLPSEVKDGQVVEGGQYLGDFLND